MPNEATLTIPGYELLELIGRGGMGVVHRARDQRLDRDVAIKLLTEKAETDSAAATRFVVEAKITGQLQHPGIPAVHELGTLPDGRPFLAMKLVKGRTLQELLRVGQDSNPASGQARQDLNLAPRADRGRFLAIFEQICHAVGYAHAHHVIHRDLKPANIMVGAFGEVQVMDWGLAKVLDTSPTRERGNDPDPLATTGLLTAIDTPKHSSATRTGSVIGTPSYMPPEQAGGEIRRLDSRSDVFGLGAVLCQLLTGQPPYPGKDANAVRLRAVRGDLHEVLTRLDGCGAESDLIALCKRCLAFKQEDRPADGQAVAAAVATIRNQAEARARQAEQDRAAALVREAEQGKRRRALLWVGGVIAAVLLAGTAVSLWQMLRAQDAEKATAAQLAKTQKAEADALEKLGFAERSNEIMGSLFEGLDPKANYATVADLRDALKANLHKAVRQLDDGSIGDPLAVANMQNRLGVSLLGLGDFKQAIVLLEKSRDTLKTKLGADQPDTLNSMNNLAKGYHDVGKLDLALPLYEETLKLTKANLGTDHRHTLETMNKLAACYRAAKKLDLALPLYEETLTLMKAKLGADHPDTLTSMNNLAAARWQAKQLDRSVPLFEETLPLMQNKLGPTHPYTLMTLANLAVNYRDAGRLADAARRADEFVNHYRQLPVLNRQQLVWFVPEAASIFTAAGQPAKAEAICRDAVAEARQHLGAEDPRLAAALVELGDHLLQQKRWLEAESTLKECLAIRQKKEPDAWTTFNAQSLLGGALAGQKKYADAEPLLLAGYEGMKKASLVASTPGETTSAPGGTRGADATPLAVEQRLAEAIERLIQLYDATGKTAEAAKWRREQAAWWHAQLQRNNAWTLAWGWGRF
jgi:serine/threonine protein kinase